MEPKKFLKPGQTAYQLWLFAAAVQALKQAPDAEKKQLLLNDMQNYRRGNWLKYNGTQEELSDMDELIREVENL
ncbi:MAG: hypothetical protein J6039_01315 [Alphaproteobacteria bacterium]|nr:hypothetical protein [Alphaproteobacteria bacterium]